MRRKESKNMRVYKKRLHLERTHALAGVYLLVTGIIVVQLFHVQVLNRKEYIARANSQYSLSRIVEPKRGEIFWQDHARGQPVPLVINETVYDVFIVPKNIADIPHAAQTLSEVFVRDEIDMLEKFSSKDDPYEVIARGLVHEERYRISNALIAQGFSKDSFGFEEQVRRSYLEGSMTAHITGFVGFSETGTLRAGQYGVEEWFNTELTGKPGIVLTDKDVQGRPIGIGTRYVEQPQDGKDVVLTIDRSIQFKACDLLSTYMTRYKAQSGTVIVMDPMSGELYALCGKPDYDPNQYGEALTSHFINPAISSAYEPGSIMKPVTMAAALDVGSVTPWTTYTDTGAEKIGPFTIRNADGKAHGINSMVDVLDKSLNTGAIFAMRATGHERFKRYVDAFGFGKLTGIELASEVVGDVKALEKDGEIYAATASFGQGITVTPLQLVVAYAAIARGGRIIKPTIIGHDETSGEENTQEARELDYVIRNETAKTLTAMLVSAVKNGFAKRGGVPGFQIAGKTGTAQIPKTDSVGYSEETIHSFIGFGPVGTGDPRFVILVKLDKPQEARFADSTAAPLFGELAQFLVTYLEIPKE